MSDADTQLTASKLHLRSANASDAAQIVAIYAPFCGTESAVSFEIIPPTAEEMQSRIKAVQEKLPWLVASDGDRVLGYVYASEHKQRAAYRWSVDVSVYLHADARGRGLGRSMYQALFDLLRLQGYINVCAGITLPNVGSEKLHLSLGFKPIGAFHRIGFKNGSWHDVLQMEMPLAPHPEQPAETQAFSRIENSPEAKAILSRQLFA